MAELRGGTTIGGHIAYHEGNIPDSSTTTKGIVQLNNTTTSTSTTQAATAAAVKAAMDKAEEAFQSASNGKTAIATAITGKGVSASSSDTFNQLATKIDNIQTGVTPAGTAVVADVLSGKTFINSTGNTLTGTMVNKSIENHHQLATDHTVWQADRVFFQPPTGYYNGASWVCVSEPNFIATNIKSGVSMLGVSGTYTSDTTSPNTNHILSGAVAYQQGVKVTGTMPNRAGVFYTTAVSALGDSGGNIVLEPQTGYYTSGKNANGFGSLLAYNANYIPSNIRAGVNIFGVVGTLNTGVSNTIADTMGYNFRTITDTYMLVSNAQVGTTGASCTAQVYNLNGTLVKTITTTPVANYAQRITNLNNSYYLEHLFRYIPTGGQYLNRLNIRHFSNDTLHSMPLDETSNSGSQRNFYIGLDNNIYEIYTYGSGGSTYSGITRNNLSLTMLNNFNGASGGFSVTDGNLRIFTGKRGLVWGTGYSTLNMFAWTGSSIEYNISPVAGILKVI